MKTTVAVLGAGAWGTALALLLTRNGQQVNLWEADEKNYEAIKKQGMNAWYMPGLLFPPTLKVFHKLEEAVQAVDSILVVVPSKFFAATLTALAPKLHKNSQLAFATKGLVPPGKLLSAVSAEILPKLDPTILTGPTFAKEVAEGLPTAILAASVKPSNAVHWAKLLSNPCFQVSVAEDIIGAQVGGTIKNILAVAVGICDGLGYGANARAALMTRGLAEMLALGQALGAKTKTLLGLPGVGDLILTCTDNQSRNRRFGLALGQGESVDAAIKKIGQVVEGSHNAEQVHYLAKQYQIELPIVEQVYKILFEKLDARAALKDLLILPSPQGGRCRVAPPSPPWGEGKLEAELAPGFVNYYRHRIR